MVINSSGERSFSKLKLNNNRRRTYMTEEKHNVSVLLRIESEILNYKDIISRLLFITLVYVTDVNIKCNYLKNVYKIKPMNIRKH